MESPRPSNGGDDARISVFSFVCRLHFERKRGKQWYICVQILRKVLFSSCDCDASRFVCFTRCRHNRNCILNASTRGEAIFMGGCGAGVAKSLELLCVTETGDNHNGFWEENTMFFIICYTLLCYKFNKCREMFKKCLKEIRYS